MHKIERGRKVVKHNFATKIEGSYPINFVGLKGGDKIIKHKIATMKDPTK